jgi:hypothetical protein
MRASWLTTVSHPRTVRDSISVILTSVIVGLQFGSRSRNPEPLPKTGGGRPTSRPAARCATPEAPRAASYTTRMGTTGGGRRIVVDHFDGLGSFENLPRDNRRVGDMWA